MPVIGFLIPPPAAAEGTLRALAAFRRGLAEAGYVEGKNLAIEYRFANFRPELIPELAGDLVRLNMKVIFSAAPEAVAAVRNATTSIPIVALDLESDPVAKGYVKTLARPGGNMTGMFLDIPELSGKHVGLLKEIVELVLVSGCPPIRARKARYYEDPELKARTLPPPRLMRPTASAATERLGLPHVRQDWEDAVAVDIRTLAEDAANSGIRREPELPEHEEIVPEPQKPIREFDPPADESDSDSERLRLFERGARRVARQASLDPADDMGL